MNAILTVSVGEIIEATRAMLTSTKSHSESDRALPWPDLHNPGCVVTGWNFDVSLLQNTLQASTMAQP